MYKTDSTNSLKKKLLLLGTAVALLGVAAPLATPQEVIQAEASSSSLKNTMIIYPTMYDFKAKKGAVENVKRYTVDMKTGKMVLAKITPQNIAGEFVFGSFNDYYIVNAAIYNPKTDSLMQSTYFVKKSEASLTKTSYERAVLFKKNQSVTLKKGMVPVYVKVKDGFIPLKTPMNVKKNTKVKVVYHSKTSVLVKIKLDKSIKGYEGKEVYVADGLLF